MPASVEGTASAGTQTPTTLPTIFIPSQAPAWTDQQLDAEGSATGGQSRLKVACLAEASAVASIRSQLLALHLDENTTLAQAAKIDPQVGQSIDRALLSAHTQKVEYLTNGVVRVRVSLELHDAWDEIHASP